MADSTSSVLASAPVPSVDLERVEKFTREPFVLEGEDASVALAEGTPRRRALDAALAEIDAGREQPSVEWRRDYSLMLGLERLLSEEEPHLADGTTLSAHQVDALSGTLIALVAELQGDRRATATAGARSRSCPPARWRSRATTLPDDEPLDWDPAEEAEEEAPRTAGRGSRRRPPLLVRARHRRRQDRRGARLRRGLAHRRHPDPHPPPQPRGPVPRRAARPRLQEAHLARRCSAATSDPQQAAR